MSEKIKAIYHIHDVCCGHATNTINELNKIAIKCKYQNLYFTEHAPLKNNDFLKRPSQDQIIALKKAINNIKKTKSYFGYELEFNKVNLKELESFKNDQYAEFLVFGNHFYGDIYSSKWRSVYLHTKKMRDLYEYYRNYRLALKSQMFSWVAHPDLWLASYQKWNFWSKILTKAMIRLAIKYDIPLGFNANGLHVKKNHFQYPCEFFWKLVSNKPVKVIVESDAHTPNVFNCQWMQKTYERAIQYGLKRNIIEKIKLRWLHQKPNELKLIIINPEDTLLKSVEIESRVWENFAKKYDLNFNLKHFKTLKKLDLKLAIIKLIEISRKLEKWDDQRINDLVQEWKKVYLKDITKNAKTIFNKTYLNLIKECNNQAINISFIGDFDINQQIVKILKLKNAYISNQNKIETSFPVIDPYYESLAHFDINDNQAIIITNDHWQQEISTYYKMICLTNQRPFVKNKNIIALENQEFNLENLQKIIK